MSRYKLPLKVSEPDGKVVVAIITQLSQDTNRFNIPYMESVKLDGDSSFAKDGIVNFIYERRNHKTVVNAVTSYIENLMLKELENEPANNTSVSSPSKPRGNKGKSDSGSNEEGQREESGGLHYSRRGTEQSGNSERERAEREPDMAESSNKKSKGRDKKRNQAL